jgi:thioredoxin-like negative regulator of GroEL
MAAGKPVASVRSAETDRKIPFHILNLRREEKSTSQQEKNLMTENDMREEADKTLDGAADESRDNDSVASKLSKELSNWRQRRSSVRPSRPNAPAQNHSEPARTIKVRGHETLVVRKPKLVQKPPTNPSASE